MRILLALLLLFPLQLQADEVVRSITVHGKAEKEVQPDVALIDVTIENKGTSLDETKRMQDKETTKLMRLVRDAKIKEQDVKTQYAQLQPHYEYNRTTKKNEFRGYRANTTVQVKIRDLDVVGSFMDALVKAKFDRVNNVRYILDDDIKHRDALLIEALENAKAKAAKLADSADVELGKPLSIQEGYKATPKFHQPMMRSMAMESVAMADGAGAVAPPSGMIQLSGTITATYELTE